MRGAVESAFRGGCSKRMLLASISRRSTPGRPGPTPCCFPRASQAQALFLVCTSSPGADPTSGTLFSTHPLEASPPPSRFHPVSGPASKPRPAAGPATWRWLPPRSAPLGHRGPDPRPQWLLPLLTVPSASHIFLRGFLGASFLLSVGNLFELT